MTRGQREAASPGEDELLSRLYRRVTERQAARFAAGYDIAAGLDRYRAWLGEHAAEEPSRPKAVPRQGSMALRDGLADTSASAAGKGTDELAAAGGTTQGSTGTGSGTLAAAVGQDAEQVVPALYGAHYNSMVVLAAMLVGDVATAEEIVQGSFLALRKDWRRLPDNETALSLLRQSVVKRSRSVLQQRVVVDKAAPQPAPDLSDAEQATLTQLEQAALVAVLRSLPEPQREALELRYYGGLSEAQIASAMGTSIGDVRYHIATGLASLSAVLEMER